MVFRQQVDRVADSLDKIGDDGRIWIFQADRGLHKQECDHVQENLDQFTPQWTSHHQSLVAQGVMALDRFVIVGLDEKASQTASGCSIDSMTHFIQGIAQELSVDLMDRVTFYFVIDDHIIGHDMNSVSEAYRNQLISGDTPVFNNLIQTKGELRSSWLNPINQSWQKKFL